MKNYFTDALLYQEIGKTSKERLSNNNDSGNEADSESEGDTLATLACEPIVACFNDPQCNNPSEDDDEWVINDNVILIILRVPNCLNLPSIALYICPCIDQACQVHLWNVWKGPFS